MTAIERARQHIAALAKEDGEHMFAREVLGGQWDHRTDVQRALRVENARDAVKAADKAESAAARAYDQGLTTQRGLQAAIEAHLDAIGDLVRLEEKYGF